MDVLSSTRQHVVGPGAEPFERARREHAGCKPVDVAIGRHDHTRAFVILMD